MPSVHLNFLKMLFDFLAAPFPLPHQGQRYRNTY